MAIRTNVARAAAAAALLLSLAGCRPECEENLHCEAGEICSNGSCQERNCNTSDQCPMETYCSDDSGTCEGGCQTDRDCYPYHRCDDDGHCVDGGCRSTVLDCSMGEFCNTITGECYGATGAYCKECEDEDDCGAGNMCLRIGGYPQTFCGVDCSLGQECPRGYTCGAVQDVTGNILGYQCITACWMLEDL